MRRPRRGKFLACVVRTGQMFGVSRIVDILRGSRSAETLRRRQDRLPEYGTGQEHAAAEWRRLADEFIRLGLLEQDMEHGSLRLTPKGQATLDGAGVLVPAAHLASRSGPSDMSRPTTRRSSPACAACAASSPTRPICRPTWCFPTAR